MENIFKRKLNESLPVIDYDAEASVYDRAVREFSNQIDRNGKIRLNDSELEVLVDYAIDYSGDENSREIAEKVRKVIENARYLKDKKLSAKDVHILLCDRDFYNYIDTIPVGASAEDVHTVYDMCLAMAKKSFFEDTGVYIYNAGEFDRYLCVSNEYENALNYNELRECQAVAEADFVRNVNSELRDLAGDTAGDDITTEELHAQCEALGKWKIKKDDKPEQRLVCPYCKDEFSMVDVESDSCLVRDVGHHDLCVCDNCGLEVFAEPQHDGTIKWVKQVDEEIDKKEIYKKVAGDKKLAKDIAKISGKKTKEITDNAKKLAGEKNESLTKNKRTTLKESDDVFDPLLNDKGELKLNKAMIFHSKNGKQYFVRNIGGNYEVWVRKSVPAPGGARLKDFFRDATQEIRNNVKLEQPQKSEGLKESIDESEGEFHLPSHKPEEESFKMMVGASNIEYDIIPEDIDGDESVEDIKKSLPTKLTLWIDPKDWRDTKRRDEIISDAIEEQTGYLVQNFDYKLYGSYYHNDNSKFLRGDNKTESWKQDISGKFVNDQDDADKKERQIKRFIKREFNYGGNDYNQIVADVVEKFGLSYDDADTMVWNATIFKESLKESNDKDLKKKVFDFLAYYTDYEGDNEICNHAYDLVDKFGIDYPTAEALNREFVETQLGKYRESLKESFRQFTNDPYEILSLMADEVEGLVRDYGYGLSDSVDEVLRSWLTNNDTVYALAKHYGQFDSADVIKEIEDQLHSDLEYMARTGNYPEWRK